MRNKINMIEPMEELNSFELMEIVGGADKGEGKNVWYYMTYILSSLTNMGFAEGDALMMSMH